MSTLKSILIIVTRIITRVITRFVTWVITRIVTPVLFEEIVRYFYSIRVTNFFFVTRFDSSNRFFPVTRFDSSNDFITRLNPCLLILKRNVSFSLCGWVWVCVCVCVCVCLYRSQGHRSYGKTKYVVSCKFSREIVMATLIFDVF